MSNTSTHIKYLIILLIVLVLYITRGIQYKTDKIDSETELCEEVELLEKQVDHLQKENDIFTSMLSEIENESGGHEILKKLWNEKK